MTKYDPPLPARVSFHGVTNCRYIGREEHNKECTIYHTILIRYEC